MQAIQSGRVTVESPPIVPLRRVEYFDGLRRRRDRLALATVLRPVLLRWGTRLNEGAI